MLWTVKPWQKRSKSDLFSQVNDQKVTMLLFDHFFVKNCFFKLELFLVCFTYLISSSQNFVTFSLKTDKVIKKSYFLQILKYLQLCLTILHMSWIYLQNMWKLLLLHNCRFADKGKIDHWQSYVKKVWYSQSSMINTRKYC